MPIFGVQWGGHEFCRPGSYSTRVQYHTIEREKGLEHGGL